MPEQAVNYLHLNDKWAFVYPPRLNSHGNYFCVNFTLKTNINHQHNKFRLTLICHVANIYWPKLVFVLEISSLYISSSSLAITQMFYCIEMVSLIENISTKL